MRYISPEFKAHLQKQVTNCAICCKVKMRSGKEFGFTSHQIDIQFDGLNYVSSTGLSMSACHFNASLAEDNLEIESIFLESAITEADVISGKFDYAEIEIFMVNYNDLSQGKVILNSGITNEIRLEEGKFTVEITGFARKLSCGIANVYTKTCQAKFGDAKCGVNLRNLEQEVEVIQISENSIILSGTEGKANGHFNDGLLKFLSGANEGAEFEIRNFINGEIFLKSTANFEIKKGDKVRISPSCDKFFDTCKRKFGNALNFRGFPHVPGFDEIMKTAGTRR